MPASPMSVGLAPTPDQTIVDIQAIQLADYSPYRFRAEVDWIELRIDTAAPTNFQTVRRRLDVEYVTPVGESNGGACTAFSVKFQAPRSWSDINQRLKELTVDHPLARPVKVIGIEVALDAYSQAHIRDDLVDMTVRFYRSASKLSSPNRRASKSKGRSHGLETVSQLRALIADGFNIYIGETDDQERQHIYLKETDSSAALPTALHRARTEFTLRGVKVPVHEFSAWRELNFTAFAPYFKFRCLKDNLPAVMAMALHSAAQIGERRPRKAAKGYCRKFSPNTQADAKLNALAFDALRELTRRWRSIL